MAGFQNPGGSSRKSQDCLIDTPHGQCDQGLAVVMERPEEGPGAQSRGNATQHWETLCPAEPRRHEDTARAELHSWVSVLSHVEGSCHISQTRFSSLSLEPMLPSCRVTARAKWDRGCLAETADCPRRPSRSPLPWGFETEFQLRIRAGARSHIEAWPSHTTLCPLPFPTCQPEVGARGCGSQVLKMAEHLSAWSPENVLDYSFFTPSPRPHQ